MLAVVLWIVGIWGALYTLQRLAAALHGDALESWLAECNVTLSLCFLRFHTERLNALFHDAGHRWRHALAAWFSMGVAFGALAACYSLFLLVDNLWRTLTAPTGAPQMLTPVVPGVNLPMNRVLSYFVCLLVNSVWHEAGHALAAAAELRRVQGFGVFLFGVYPGAYVEMGGDELASLSPLQQLRVVCAGAWHNITLAALVALVALAAPMLLSPWYYQPGGVVVVDVALQSPLRGHLLPGSVLTSINDCPVHTQADWTQCLLGEMRNHDHLPDGSRARRGYCEDAQRVQDAVGAGDIECCTNPLYDGQLQCFMGQKQVCLNARAVAKNRPCAETEDCPLYHHCLTPLVLAPGRLLKLGLSTGAYVMFSGPPLELAAWVQIGSQLPKSGATDFNSLDFPLWLDACMRDWLSLCSALAVLNLAPAFYLDGEHAFRAALALVCVRSGLFRDAPAKRERFCQVALWAVTIVMGASLLVSLRGLL